MVVVCKGLGCFSYRKTMTCNPTLQPALYSLRDSTYRVPTLLLLCKKFVFVLTQFNAHLFSMIFVIVVLLKYAALE